MHKRNDQERRTRTEIEKSEKREYYERAGILSKREVERRQVKDKVEEAIK